jgi:hypothetical protein
MKQSKSICADTGNCGYMNKAFRCHDITGGKVGNLISNHLVLHFLWQQHIRSFASKEK